MNAYQRLVDNGRKVGQVVAAEGARVEVEGLGIDQPGGLVMFADGSKAVCYSLDDGTALVARLADGQLEPGSGAVVMHDRLVTKVSPDYLGRVLDISGQPLDSSPQLKPNEVRDVFSEPPALDQLRAPNTQLPTGNSVIDLLLPVGYGQRLSLLIEDRPTYSQFTKQLLSGLATEQIVVYALIGRPQSELEALIKQLSGQQLLARSVVIASSDQDPLLSSWLVPFVAASVGEYFWQQQKRDVVVVYDDLSRHLQLQSELNQQLGGGKAAANYGLSGLTADYGQLSMRSGRAADTSRTLTAVMVGRQPADYPQLAAISDGRLVFDAADDSAGQPSQLSLRASRGLISADIHAPGIDKLVRRIKSALADYRLAARAKLSEQALTKHQQRQLALGHRLSKLLEITKSQQLSLTAQRVVFEVGLALSTDQQPDLARLVEVAARRAAEVTDDNSFKVVVQLTAQEIQQSAKPANG